MAKSLSLALGIPVIDVDHMKAHILAHFAEDPKPNFPFLCLTVSGGHTQIVRVDSAADMTILGETIDDAAGEAFDKSGKIMGLKYPAGPQMDKLAQMGSPVFTFSEPNIAELNFSFSGLKTSILYFLKAELKKNPQFIDENLNNMCASIQHTIVSILIKKLKSAVEQTGITDVAISGGVSANSGLRNRFLTTGQELGWNTYIPAFQFCTDNAGMIGVAAAFSYDKGEFADLTLIPQSRLKM